MAPTRLCTATVSFSPSLLANSVQTFDDHYLLEIDCIPCTAAIFLLTDAINAQLKWHIYIYIYTERERWREVELSCDKVKYRIQSGSSTLTTTEYSVLHVLNTPRVNLLELGDIDRVCPLEGTHVEKENGFCSSFHHAHKGLHRLQHQSAQRVLDMEKKHRKENN